jgi:hypothetical protein
LFVAPSHDEDDFGLTAMPERNRFTRGARLPLVNDHESRVASYLRPPTPIANCC